MEKITSEVRQNWLIICFIASMILWYGDTNYRLNTVEAQQAESTTTNKGDSDKIEQLVVDMAVVKSQGQATDKNIDSLDKKMDSLDVKVDYLVNHIR